MATKMSQRVGLSGTICHGNRAPSWEVREVIIRLVRPLPRLAVCTCRPMLHTVFFQHGLREHVSPRAFAVERRESSVYIVAISLQTLSPQLFQTSEKMAMKFWNFISNLRMRMNERMGKPLPCTLQLSCFKPPYLHQRQRTL